MAENKTKKTETSVEDFINAVDNEQKRKDSWELVRMMKKITGREPRLWGSSLVGFGTYHYKYASGREGDFFITGFSPRKTALTVYIMPGFEPYPELMEQLGPYKTGKSCLYLKNLDAIDRTVLERLVLQSVQDMRKKYPCD